MRDGGVLLFGPYRIEWELGNGPFGRTYRARHADLSSLRVALKVLDEGVIGDARFMTFLRAELDKLAVVHHPGVADLRGLERDGDRLGLVTGLVDGDGVQQVFADRRPSQAELVSFLSQTLAALDVLHRQDVLHLDLRPSNVARSRGGRFVLLDTGLGSARQFAKRDDLGRFRYRAPELAIGDAVPGSDLYQLGLMAWELAVGRPACPAQGVSEALLWHRTEGPEDIRIQRSDLPDWLGEFIRGLCAPNPSLRPHRAVDALTVLREQRAPSPRARVARAVDLSQSPTLVPVKS